MVNRCNNGFGLYLSRCVNGRKWEGDPFKPAVIPLFYALLTQVFTVEFVFPADSFLNMHVLQWTLRPSHDWKKRASVVFLCTCSAGIIRQLTEMKNNKFKPQNSGPCVSASTCFQSIFYVFSPLCLPFSVHLGFFFCWNSTCSEKSPDSF